MQNDVKKATLEDVAILSEIHALSWKKAFKGIMPQDFLDDLKEDYWVKFFENGIKNKIIEVLIVCNNNNPVGEVTYGKARDESLPDWGEIISIYVLPEYFHKGFGTKLIKSAVQNLKEQGFDNIYLWVLRENHNAQKFYKKHGFIETDQEYHFEKGGKKLVDIKYILKI